MIQHIKYSQKDSKILKNLYLYLFGKFLSDIGTVMYSFAMGLYILKITGSALNFAFTFILSLLPRLVLLPFVGVIVDKIDKKKIIVFTDILNSFILFLLFMYLEKYEFHLILVYGSIFFLTASNTFFSLAMDASLPNIVDEKRLVKINSFNQIAGSGSSIIGPLLAGLFYATVDINFFILLNAISFIISGCSELFIDFKLNIIKKSIPKKQPFFKALKDGVNYILINKDILHIYIYFLLANFFFFSNVIIVPYIIIKILKMTSLQYGIIQGAAPCGLLFMSIIWNILNKQNMLIKLGYLNIIIGCTLCLMGLPSLSIASALNDKLIILFFIIIKFFLGGVFVSIRIPLKIFLQKRIEESYRGRILSLLNILSQAILPISSLLYGFLIDSVHPFLIAFVCGTSIVSMGFIQLNDRKLNKIF